MNSFHKSLGRDRHGGIEGLPLQLMIVILVATMGTAVIVGWMGDIEAPHSIGEIQLPTDGKVEAVDGIVDNLPITVFDQDGNPLEGATVILKGCGASYYDEDADENKPAIQFTDVKGVAHFTNLKVQPNNNKYGFVSVSVSKSDYGEDNGSKILVIFTGQS